ncbi:glutaredoxin family protein [bacterium]|nr:glutaredoxin family protein [bacterium]
MYFYGNGCSHCAKVEKFFEKENIEKKYNIDMREIYFNRDNVLLFQEYVDKLGIDSSKA